MSSRPAEVLPVRGSSPVWHTAASTARWQEKVRPPIATTMSAKRSSPSRASIRVARRPGIENLPLLPLMESSAAAAAWRHAWMAVVGWLEVGGTLRISPLFLESASWMRLERRASIRTSAPRDVALSVRPSERRPSRGCLGPRGARGDIQVLSARSVHPRLSLVSLYPLDVSARPSRTEYRGGQGVTQVSSCGPRTAPRTLEPGRGARWRSQVVSHACGPLPTFPRPCM